MSNRRAETTSLRREPNKRLARVALQWSGMARNAARVYEND